MWLQTCRMGTCNKEIIEMEHFSVVKKWNKRLFSEHLLMGKRYDF